VLVTRLTASGRFRPTVPEILSTTGMAFFAAVALHPSSPFAALAQFGALQEHAPNGLFPVFPHPSKNRSSAIQIA